MASDSSSKFRPGVFHIYLQIRKAQPKGWEKKNKRTNTGLGQLQAQEEESLCDTFMQLFVHFFYKEALGMLTHLWLSSPTASLCWLSPPLDCYLKPTVFLCPALSTGSLSLFSGTFLPSSTSGLAEDLVLSLLSGFRAKTDKEIIWVAPTQTETNCYTLCLIIFFFCAAVKKDLLLFAFHFLNHIQVFSSAILSVCRLKFLCSCVSSRFCFLNFVVFLYISCCHSNQSFLLICLPILFISDVL